MSELLDNHVQSVIEKDGLEHLNETTSRFDKRLVMINKLVITFVNNIKEHHTECTDCDGLYHDFRAKIPEDSIRNKGETTLLNTMIEYKLIIDHNILVKLNFKKNKNSYIISGLVFKQKANEDNE